MKKQLLAFCIAAVFSVTGIAQTSQQLVAMLPQVEGWTLSAKPETFTRENLFDRINGAADAFLICNFVEMTAIDYTKNGTDKYVTLQMYRHATPNDAFAIYSAERSPGPTFLKIGAEAYCDTGLLHFLSGSMYVKIFTSDDTPATADMIEKVARLLAARIYPSATLPAMLRAFPAENKQPLSETYIVESFLGHKFLHNAWRATYAKSGKEYQLFIIDAQTKTAAEKMLRDYYTFNKQPAAALPAENDSFTMPDRFNGDITMLWRDRYIFGILNDSGAAIEAPPLLKQLSTATQ